MHMTFWWDTKIDNLLFKGCNIRTTGVLVAACICFVVLGILFEWLKLLQAKQRQRELMIRAKQIRTICQQNETSTLLSSTRNIPSKPKKIARVCYKLWDAFLWLNMQILGYLLMLVVMFYNGWLMISLLGGSAIGYFIFGPTFLKINAQNCQTVREAFCYVSCGDSEANNETEPSSLPSTSSSAPTTPQQVTVCIHSSASEVIS